MSGRHSSAGIGACLTPENPPTPKTSLKVPRNVQEIMSTGSATSAKFRYQEDINVVKDAIRRDIEGHPSCGFEEMLYAMLRMAAGKTADVDENQAWAEDVLAKCLEVATNFLNSTCDDATDLRMGLTDYCNGNTEQARYPGLASAFTAILRYFRGAGNASLPAALQRGDDDLGAILKVNDSTVIRATRHEGFSSRKPGFVQVWWKTLRKLYGDEHTDEDWETTVIEMLQRLSQVDKAGAFTGKLEWLFVLMSIELRKVKKLDPKSVRRKYYPVPLDPADEIAPLQVPSPVDGDDVELDTNLFMTPQAGPSLASTSTPDPLLPTMARKQSRAVTTPSAEVVRKNGRIVSQMVISEQETVTLGKRKAETVLSGVDRKRLRLTTQQPTGCLHPTVQSALYATERLPSGPWIMHTPGVTLIDERMHLWWYDREGAIQTRGIDILRHLPNFVVTFLLFQRLKERDMGVSPLFEVEHGFAEIEIEGHRYRFRTSDMRNNYALIGRGITGVPVINITTPGKPEEGLFLKISWSECVRDRKADIIRRICRIAKEKGEMDILKHIPDLRASQTHDQHSTASIRKLLGVTVMSARVLCCSVFKQLRPITTLPPQELWKAYWEVIKMHYRLWHWGIRHGDISVSNLMHDGGTGVLIDYDLAHIVDPSRSHTNRGYDRTGTVPFMSLDLLTDKAWSGHVERLYRHELESFCWVLLWICACYDDEGQVNIPKKYYQWIADYGTCHDSKSAFPVRDLVTTQFFRPIFLLALKIFGFWRSFYSRKSEAEMEVFIAASIAQELAKETNPEESRTTPEIEDVETLPSEKEGFELLRDLLKALITDSGSQILHKVFLDDLPLLDVPPNVVCFPTNCVSMNEVNVE